MDRFRHVEGGKRGLAQRSEAPITPRDTVASEVIVMFKWIRSRRPGRDRGLTPESAEDKRDSGEEEYASQEEDDREVAPDGETRVKTDDI